MSERPITARSVDGLAWRRGTGACLPLMQGRALTWRHLFRGFGGAWYSLETFPQPLLMWTAKLKPQFFPLMFGWSRAVIYYLKCFWLSCPFPSHLARKNRLLLELFLSVPICISRLPLPQHPAWDMWDREKTRALASRSFFLVPRSLAGLPSFLRFWDWLFLFYI